MLLGVLVRFVNSSTNTTTRRRNPRNDTSDCQQMKLNIVHRRMKDFLLVFSWTLPVLAAWFPCPSVDVSTFIVRRFIQQRNTVPTLNSNNDTSDRDGVEWNLAHRCMKDFLLPPPTLSLGLAVWIDCSFSFPFLEITVQ